MPSQEDENDRVADDPEQPVDAGKGTAQMVGSRTRLHCPRCKSTHIRGRSRPLLLNVGACIAFAALAVSVFARDWAGLTAVLFWMLLVALYALPVTACIALVGRYRCLGCALRFELAPEKEGQQAVRAFPWCSYSVGTVLLFLLCVVGPAVARVRSGGRMVPDLPTTASTIVLFGLALWGTMLWQVVWYFLLRSRLRRASVWAVLFVLPALAMGGWFLYRSSPAVRVRVFLSYADFASLPPSAAEIRLRTYWWPDEADAYVRFRAEAEDIERYLRASPVLQDAKWEPPSTERTRFPHDLAGPAWYRQEIKESMRRCVVRLEGKRCTVTVVVDDERHRVYIKVTWSRP